MATFIKGDSIILYIYEATAWKPIACLTSNSLNQTRSIIETQTKCSPGVTEKETGAMSYDISFDGKYIDTGTGGDTTKTSHDKLFEIMNSGTSVEWKMDTGLSDPTAYYGTGVLNSLSMTAGTGDELVEFSGAIAGSGAIVTVDPHA